MRKLRRALFLGILFLGLTAASCPTKKTVTVHYRPLANTFKIESNGKTATAEKGIFRIYRIFRIDNNEAGAETFAFRASKVYVRKPGHAELMQVRKENDNPYSEQSAGENVSPHSTADHLPYYLVMWDHEPPEATDDWVPLRYDNSGGESILLIQDPAEPKPVFKQAMTAIDLPVQPFDQ
jgi:hypothetical protein